MKVVSWNVLAAPYVRKSRYPLVDPSALDPLPRHSAVLTRLAAFEADVLCLQEMEPATFAAAAARLDRYVGHYTPKRGRPDGCAIFVRRSLGMPSFRELTYADESGHVALAASLDGVGVACTHLKWEHAWVPAERQLARAQLAELLDAWVVPGAPWILTGDLNVEPESAPLQLAYARGFRDAYASQPDACTFNADASRRRIDFILHTSHFSAVPMPIRALPNATPLPSPEEPSDHLAIGATLSRSDSACPAR